MLYYTLNIIRYSLVLMFLSSYKKMPFWKGHSVCWKITAKMKTKEHSTDVRNKVIEMQRHEKYARKICKSLNVPLSAVESSIRKWKVHHSTRPLPENTSPKTNQSKTSTGERRLLKIHPPLSEVCSVLWLREGAWVHNINNAP